MSRSQAVPIPTKRGSPYPTANSYSGPSFVLARDSNERFDYFARDECPATPHNTNAELIEWSREDPHAPLPLFDGPSDQLSELEQFGIDPNGYGSNINRIQDMWRPHSL